MKIQMKLLCVLSVCLFPTLVMANLLWVRITAISTSLPSYVKLEPGADPHAVVASGRLAGDGASCELRFENTYDAAFRAYSNARLCVIAEAGEVCVAGKYLNDRAFVYADAAQTRVVSEDRLVSLSFAEQSVGYLVKATNAGLSLQCLLR